MTLIYGILGIVNWAHGELYMLGAFVGLFLVVRLHLPFLVGLIGSMFIMALFGMAMERFVFRPLRGAHEMNMIIGTLGISIFLMNGAIALFSPNPLRFPTYFSNTYSVLAGLIHHGATASGFRSHRDIDGHIQLRNQTDQAGKSDAGVRAKSECGPADGH